LYRLVESRYEEVKGQWEERFERRYGFWRGFVDQQVLRYLDCGLFENGFARIRCPECHAEYLLAFSCKTRELCPSCAAKRSAATAALLREEILEHVGHSQWVLTIPKLLRLYFLFHRELLGGLARAAWETARELIRAAVVDEALQPGMVAVVQTAGDLGGWHPHVHALVSRGGWSRAGEWVAVPYVDEPAAELLFRHKVIRLLQHAGLLSQERTELLLSWRHTGFSVHTRVRVEPEDSAAVERLARYIMRPPVALERMQWDGGGAVQYRLLAGHDTRLLPDEGDELVDPADFLARVLMHVPEPRRHRVRYYGRYSNASRGKRRKAVLEVGEVVSPGPCSAASRSSREDGDESSVDVRLLRRRWRELIKRIYEVDPLVCPKCQAEMRIIAFIVDPEVIDTILRHLARKEAERDRAPPGCPDGNDAPQ
jgi:hypothetical protein